MKIFQSHLIIAKCFANRLQFATDYKVIKRYLTEICG